MSVVITSVVILFALIFLGFFLGKGKVIRQESIPDLSNMVIKVTMPVTVFCSIVDNEGDLDVGACGQMIVLSLVVYGISFVVTWLVIKPFKIPDKERGVWMFSGLISNVGFMGLPLAAAIFGAEGMIYMAIGTIFCNLLIFSVGVIMLTRGYPIKGKLGLRQIVFNNITIAVIVGVFFLVLKIPVPAVIEQLLSYLGNITGGLAMLVTGLSMSRLAFREVFSDRKMLFLPVLRLLIIPLIAVLIVRLVPFDFNPIVAASIVLIAALPAPSGQAMITEQYGTNTAGASRAIFLTTLFSVVTIPLMMMLVM